MQPEQQAAADADAASLGVILDKASSLRDSLLQAAALAQEATLRDFAGRPAGVDLPAHAALAA